jgi:hypothetical protein
MRTVIAHIKSWRTIHTHIQRIDEEKCVIPYIENGCINTSRRIYLACSEVIEHDRLHRVSLDNIPLLDNIVHFYSYTGSPLWTCRDAEVL